MKKLILILLFLTCVSAQDTLRVTMKKLHDAIETATAWSNNQLWWSRLASENDSVKDGKSILSPKQYFAQVLITATNNLPRDSTNKISIITYDNFTNDSTYTIPAYVRVYAPLGTFPNKALWTFGTGASLIDATNLSGVALISNITGLQDSLNNRQITYRYTTTGKTSNTTLTNIVPAGCRIKDIVITNTTANQVYISIGSGSGTMDVANTILVPASDFIVIQPSAIFSSSTTQTLYLHSTNWNSSNLNLIMIFEKLF